MSQNLLQGRSYTVEQYIDLDSHSEEKYEYFDGKVFAMTGGSPNHSRIAINFCAAVRELLRGRDCEVFNSDMRIRVPDALPYRYPDASVVCGKPIFETVQSRQILVNPVVLAEILSPSTAAYDLGDKFTAYQSIPSFEQYLAISQTRPHVIHHVKQEPRKWLRVEIVGIESSITVEALHLTIPLKELYDRVVFEPLADISPGLREF